MGGEVTLQDCLIGLEFGHYRILEKIGSGGMGVVFRGIDSHLEREVAIKVLKPGAIADDLARKRFRNEARVLSKLNHPNIATVHDFETQDGRDFLVMEYIPGVTLSDKLSLGPLPEEEATRLGVQLCDGLAAAHDHGIVHRDLKPGNLRLTTDGRLKILDFGLAKFREPFLQQRGAATTLGSEALSGTLAYMAPEQLTGQEIDARTDIYAAGLILYEMATGQRPFSELRDGKLLAAILHDSPIPPGTLNPKLSAEFERIVGKCLEKGPENRYQSVHVLGQELRYFRPGGHSSATRNTGAARHLPRFSLDAKRRKWTLFWVALLVVLGIGVGLRFGKLDRLANEVAKPDLPHDKQLAVLPFVVTGDGPETVAFGAGLTETLTAQLTQLTSDPLLQVVPAPEMRAKRIATSDGARAEFGVNLVLEGSLHKSGNQLRINYILEDTRTRRQLRAASLTVAAGDVFRAEDAVVNDAIEMLGLPSRLMQHGGLESYGTQIAGAYDYYLQGRGYLQNYDRAENLDNAIQVFQRALALDKNYALAYAGLGDAYWQKYETNKQAQWLKKSQDSCRIASQLDAQLPAAHSCLGTLYVGTGNYAEAAKEFSQVLQREPTNDAAYNGLATAYERLGNLQEAESTFKRAVTLRPHYWATYNWLGVFYYHQARFAEASDMFRQVVALAPDSVRGYYNLAGSSLEEGRYEDALRASQHSIAIQPSDYGYLNLGAAYFSLKRYAEAIPAFEQAVHFSENDPLLWWNLGDGYYWAPGRRADSVAAYEKCAAVAAQQLKVNPKDSSLLGVLAICHAMLGQKKPAMEALNSGLRLAPDNLFLMFQAALVHNQFDEREKTLSWLARCRAAGYSQVKIRDHPNFASLRPDPRFQELLRAP